jgi:hypothetical protein
MLPKTMRWKAFWPRKKLFEEKAFSIQQKMNSVSLGFLFRLSVGIRTSLIGISWVLNSQLGIFSNRG